MKYSAYRKDFRREIKNTYSRFISILCIVTLGVAFYAGIRSSGPDMKKSVDKLYDDSLFMDLRIYDTAGLTEEDVKQISSLSEVEEAQGIYSVDMVDDTTAEKKIVKLVSKSDEVNRLEVTDGREIEKRNECLMDEAFLKKYDYKIGDTIKIKSGTDIPAEYIIAGNEFTIVGTFIHPEYLKSDRGDTTIGNGKVEGIISVMPEIFVTGYYTEIVVRAKDALGEYCYTDRYDEIVEKTSAKIRELKESYIITGREHIQSYSEFGMDAERIDKIGKIVPVIFYIVAALVSLTTMTRMVDEQRTLIGTYKAIGYSKYRIAMRYILYAMLATFGGSILGIMAGSSLIPRIIINAYKMLYPNLYVIVTPVHVFHCLTAVLISVLCVIGATIVSCYRSLRTSAAELMRPAAPKHGKRIILEHIPFIWKHMNFTWKSVARNISRYKKRIFMTIFGICGCMSLLLVGFGIKDSISSIVEIQYNDRHKYDVIAKYAEGMDGEKAASVNEKFEENKQIKSYINVYSTTSQISNGEKSLSGYIYVTDERDKFNDYISFGSSKDGKRMGLSDDGVVITKKLAKLLKVKKGDEISLLGINGEDEHRVKITDVAENYIFHYVYMSDKLYEQIYGTEFRYNQALIMQENSDEELSEWLLSQEQIASVTTISSLRENFDYMLNGLDIIIIVIVIAAGGLAFVVLYNLNNINICERVRELATLKVLGFYDGEVSSYVFRENVILTIVGILTGYAAGDFLHKYVIDTVEMDMAMFGRNIHAASFVYATVITVAFSLVINLTMHYKLKKIDMTTSLKSIE